MQVYEFTVALRFWHPTIDPAVISQELGIVPLHHWRAGEARVTPKGTDIGGTRQSSYWHADVTEHGWRNSCDGDAEASIVDLIDRLEPHKHFLATTVESGGRALIHVSLHGAGNYALEFSPDLLARCGSLGLALATEVYGIKQSGVA